MAVISRLQQWIPNCSFRFLLSLSVLLLLRLSASGSFAGAAAAEADPTDTDALTVFCLRTDTHGILSANWSTGTDACSALWRGVLCTSGRVTSISLPSLDLRGPLSPLASLSELRSLDLHDNRLNGTLPLFPNLKLLYLSHNDLSGELPPHVGLLMRRLLRIDLSHNNFRGPIPPALANLTRLLTLRLQNNLLSGTVPDLSASLPALKDFDLSNNELTGRLPDGMRRRFGEVPFAGNAGLCWAASTTSPACKEGASAASASWSSTSVVPSSPSSMPAGSTPAALVAAAGNDHIGVGNRILGRAAIVGIAVANVGFLLVLVASALLLIYCCFSPERQGEAEEGDGSEKRRSGSGGGQHDYVGAGKGGGGGGSECGDGDSEAGAARMQAKLVFFDVSNDEDDDDESSSDGAASLLSDGGRKARKMGARSRPGRWSSTGGRQQQRFELEDLLRASAEMIGKGSLGTVYRAVLEDGCMVAVKRLRDGKPCPRKEFEGYMELIGRASHPNLVPLWAYYYARQEKLLVYDFLPNATLHALIHGHRGEPSRVPLDWTTRVGLALDVARGLAYIHQLGGSGSLSLSGQATATCCVAINNNLSESSTRSSSSRRSSKTIIPHGNVTSGNVLLDGNGVARLSDFGLVLLLDPAQATANLTGYRSPEQAETKRLSQEADTYAFGVVLLELLTGKPPNYSPHQHHHHTPNKPPPPAAPATTNLPEWVRSVVREEWTAEVFDVELLRYKNVEEEMVAMLHVALACVARQPEQRPPMAEVVNIIASSVCNKLKPPLPFGPRHASPSQLQPQ